MKRPSIFRLILMLMILLFTRPAQAQFRQFGIGGPDNEVAVRVRTLPDGTGTIIAGYRYQPIQQGETDVKGAQMILLKVNPAGTTILWQTEFGILQTNNQIKDMLITHDGNIVVVGTIGRSTAYLNNNAAIMKFDAGTGNMIWENSFNSGTVGGEEFNGVTELGATRSYALVAVGSYDQRPSIADNLISIYDNATGAHLHSERHCANSGVSESYNGVCTDATGESVYIVGSFRGGVFGDGVVRMFDISTGSAVTLNWDRYYNFVLPGIDPQNPLTLNNNSFSQVFLRGTRLLIMGGSLNGFTTVGGAGESILRIDASNGGGAELWQIQHSTTAYTGYTRMLPINDNDLVNVQAPHTAWYDPIVWTAGVNPNASLSVADLTGATANAIELFTDGGGLHSLHDIDADPAYDNFYFAGCTNDPTGYGNNDIYFVDVLASTEAPGCILEQAATIVTVNPQPVTPGYNVQAVTFNAVTVATTTPTFAIKPLCAAQEPPHYECDGTAFDETLTDLTYTGSYTDSGGCSFIVTATGITSPGWTIIGYLWTYGAGTIWNATSSTTDVQTITLTYSGSDAVHVKYFAVNANGDTCYTERSIKLHCKRPPCYFDTCSKLTVTQLLTTGGGTTGGHVGDTTSNPTDDSCTFTACVDVCTAFDIVGYSWTLSNGTSVTHHTSSGHDCWTFRLGPGESLVVSVVAHIVDPYFPDGTDPCCRAAFSEKVYCGKPQPDTCDCFDEPNVTLVSTPLTTTLANCRFSVTATAAMLNRNCQIVSYEWVEGGVSTVVPSSALSDTRIITVPTGTGMTVDVYIHALTPTGETCTVHKSIYLSCDDDTSNCDCFDEPNVTLIPTLIPSPGECRWSMTATAAMLNPNCQIISYEWVEGGVSTIVYSSALSDTRSIVIPFPTGMTIDVYISAISPSGETCTVHKSIYLACDTPPLPCACFDDPSSGIYENYIGVDLSGNCEYDVTGFASLIFGDCVVTGHYWTINGISTPITYGGMTIDNRTVSVPPGGSTTVSITFMAINGAGEACNITKTLTLYCDPDPEQRSAGNGKTSAIKDGNLGASASSIKVFPNPTQGNVTVESTATDIKTIEVMDVNGKKVGQYMFNNVKTANIPLQKLVPGAYMLKINGRSTKVVIKGSGQ